MLNLVVAADGSGDYKAVSAVMARTSKNSYTRYAGVKPKVDCENVVVPNGRKQI